MEQLDFKTITSDAITKICSMSFERPRRFYCGPVTIVDASPEMLRKMLIANVWGECISQLNSRHATQEIMVAERALAAIMRSASLPKKGVAYRKDSFRLQLPNGQYRIYKNWGGKTTHACPWPTIQLFEIRIPGEFLAEFMMRFDAEIPTIVAHVPELLEAVKNKQLAAKRRQKEEDLKNKVIQTLVDQYLKPLGLYVHSKFGEGDQVSVDINQELSAHMEMPFEQLVERLKDPDAILASLRVREPFSGILDGDELVIP